MLPQSAAITLWLAKAGRTLWRFPANPYPPPPLHSTISLIGDGEPRLRPLWASSGRLGGAAWAGQGGRSWEGVARVESPFWTRSGLTLVDPARRQRVERRALGVHGLRVLEADDLQRLRGWVRVCPTTPTQLRGGR